MRCLTRIYVALCLGASSLNGSALLAQTEWLVRANVFRTKYYSVKTDLPKDEALELGRHMDMTFDAYARMFAGLKVRTPAKLQVLLFATEQDYLETLRIVFKNDGTGSWGKCISRGKSITLVGWKGRHTVERLKPLLQHEGFHQFARHLFPKLPTWANEGIAEVFGRGVAVHGKIALGEVSANDKRRMADAIEKNRFKPFGEIFTMEQRKWNQTVRQGSEASLNYLQAWSITHFFLYADEGKYQDRFIRFLVGLNRGLEWQQAFVGAFGNPNFSGVEALWLAHAKTQPPMDYMETLRRMEFLASGLEELRKQSIHPTTLDELQQQLRRIEFHHTSKLFGEPKRFRAATDLAFQIPYARYAAGDVSFQLVDARGRSPKKKVRVTKNRRAPPLNITTIGLEPSKFGVHWKRVRGKNEYKPLFVIQ